MIVHLAAPRYQMAEGIKHMRLLIEAIHEEGHTLIRDWVEPAYNLELKHGVNHPIDWQKVYHDCMDDINKADVVIADCTIRSFSVGYQVAAAAHMKKPTLVLRQQNTDDSFFASGIDIGVEYKEYADKNVKTIVKKFLADNDIQTKDMRFNFFIDRPIYNYLRWAAHKTGKTKAEILRDLVSKEIDKANNIDNL